MRVLLVVLLLIIISAGVAIGEKKNQTEAEQDGLSGLVHSVVMIDRRMLFKLDPEGAWVVQNIPSGSAEYDSEGFRTKVGNPDANGEFQGQMRQFTRDTNGRVVERTIRLLPSQDVLEHDVYGSFGLVESTSFSWGKPDSVHTFSYDQLGNVLDDLRTDGDGKPILRTRYRRNSNGAWTERTMWVKGILHSNETYNPDSDFQRYEQYDNSGGVITTFTHSHGRVESYWSASTDPNGGTPIIDNLDNGDTKTWICHDEERACVGRTRHSVYLDDAKHNPIMTEILADNGRPLFRAFYEYQIDERENWTTRKVWIQSGEQGERAPYEIDSRTITYWTK